MNIEFINAVCWAGSTGGITDTQHPPTGPAMHQQPARNGDYHESGPMTDTNRLQPLTSAVVTLLVGDTAGCAGSVWNHLKLLQDDAQVACYWVPRFQDALAVIKKTPVELIFYGLPLDVLSRETIQLLRQVAGSATLVVLTGNEDPDPSQKLRELGIHDQLSRPNITRASLQRIVDHAVERRALHVQIESSLRRERLRGALLARIATNAPLQNVLAELAGALQQEICCESCGFAIELHDGTGKALLWPENNCTATQLASDVLTHARLNPGSTVCGLQFVQAGWVQTISWCGRLVGALALLPGQAAPADTTLRTYATLASELVALAVDRLQTAESLRQSQEDLRLLSAQLLNIQEAERQRIAGDLHDVIGQSLSVVKVSIEEAQNQFTNSGTHEVAEVLGRLVPWVKQALSEVRRISMDLRPAIIDDLGILPTLSWFFREFGASCRTIAVESRIAITEADIPEALKIAIFRILQEAFSNVVKHAQATRIQVVLQRFGSNIQLAVLDNGVGFELATHGCQLEGCKSGLGLASMRQRACVSGGSYTLESTPGVGTCIVVNWYLPE